MKRTDLIRKLEEAGCVLIRQGGKHDWYGNPATGPTFSLINSARFGQILGAQPTRKIQFALKYTF